MNVRWSDEAVSDLEHIADYLLGNFPDRAEDMVVALYEAPNSLLVFPNRGRIGKKPGTRELVLVPLPYILVYSVGPEAIYIARLLHGAQKWP